MIKMLKNCCYIDKVFKSKFNSILRFHLSLLESVVWLKMRKNFQQFQV